MSYKSRAVVLMFMGPGTTFLWVGCTTPQPNASTVVGPPHHVPMLFPPLIQSYEMNVDSSL